VGDPCGRGHIVLRGGGYAAHPRVVDGRQYPGRENRTNDPKYVDVGARNIIEQVYKQVRRLAGNQGRPVDHGGD